MSQTTLEHQDVHTPTWTQEYAERGLPFDDSDMGQGPTAQHRLATAIARLDGPAGLWQALLDEAECPTTSELGLQVAETLADAHRGARTHALHLGALLGLRVWFDGRGDRHTLDVLVALGTLGRQAWEAGHVREARAVASFVECLAAEVAHLVGEPSGSWWRTRKVASSCTACGVRLTLPDDRSGATQTLACRCGADPREAPPRPGTSVTLTRAAEITGVPVARLRARAVAANRVGWLRDDRGTLRPAYTLETVLALAQQVRDADAAR